MALVPNCHTKKVPPLKPFFPKNRRSWLKSQTKGKNLLETPFPKNRMLWPKNQTVSPFPKIEGLKSQIVIRLYAIFFPSYILHSCDWRFIFYVFFVMQEYVNANSAGCKAKFDIHQKSTVGNLCKMYDEFYKFHIQPILHVWACMYITKNQLAWALSWRWKWISHIHHFFVI